MIEIGIHLIALLFSAGVVFIIINIREIVKIQRQGIIRDVDLVFRMSSEKDGHIVPSLEFLKYKYYMDGKEDQCGGRLYRDDYKTVHWVLSAIPLATTMFLLNLFSIYSMLSGKMLLEREGIGAAFALNEGFNWIVVASYVAGLIFAFRSLFRAINNFDLSPFSLISTWISIGAGCVIAIVFVYSLVYVGTPSATGSKASAGIFSLVLLTSFAIGYLPDVAVRQLIGASRLNRYKKENLELYKSFTAIPVEIIDGIDTEIRSRLYDHNIIAVQNLAAVNPLMLYVETPYGVYQIIDWVSQAQLCCSVGPRALLQLWAIGIRTIFDLERAIERDYRNDDILLAIGGIILPNADKRAYPDAIVANINMRLMDPHVLRLRQIVHRVGDLFGEEAKRVPARRKVGGAESRDAVPLPAMTSTAGA